MTTTAAVAEPQVKTLTIEPVCSLEEGVKRFEGLYLDNSYVKQRLTESTRVMTPEGETKFLFLKNVLPQPIVESAWRTCQQIKFSPSKHSRRKALRGAGGGEQLFGWIEFPTKNGMAPMLTAETREQWPQFRALWPLLYFIQYWFWKMVPEVAEKQIASAGAARERRVDYLFRTAFQDADTKFYPSREKVMESYREMERDNPEAFDQWFLQTFAHFNPEYFDKLIESAKANTVVTPGLQDGAAMMGYTVPGTMFSTVTVNQTALFRSHADRNNLAGALGCLTAFGVFTGGNLCFPRFGISCPFKPGDLLIGDTNREQHGNIGPLSGNRISVVTYMRNDLGTK
jgi:hypothetical protein